VFYTVVNSGPTRLTRTNDPPPIFSFRKVLASDLTEEDQMERARFTEEQIIAELDDAEHPEEIAAIPLLGCVVGGARRPTRLCGHRLAEGFIFDGLQAALGLIEARPHAAAGEDGNYAFAVSL
jgi:hypothetical protein